MGYIRNHKKRTQLAAASIISLSSPWVFADGDTKVQKVEQLDKITFVAEQQESYYVKESQNAKMTAPLLDTARTVNIISKKEIDERAATSLQDILRTTPGITLGSGEGGTPMGDRPFIRGYEASTDILIDGMRDYARGSHESFNLEAVEVSKGPGSVYSGRGSTGGTINLVTKKPKNKTESEVTSEYQNSGKGHAKYRFTTDNNVAINDNIAVRLNAMLDQGEVARRDNVETDRWGVAPSITFGMNGPTRLTAGYSRLEFNDTPDMGIPFSNASNPDRKTPIESMPFETNFGRPDIDYRNYTSEIFSLNFEHDFNDALKLRIAAQDLQTIQEYFFTRLSFGCVASSGTACQTEGPGLTYNRANRQSYRTSHVNAAQADLQAQFKTGSIAHDLITGIDYSKERIGTRSGAAVGAGSETVDFYNPTQKNYSGFHIPWGAWTNEGEIEAKGIYVFDTISLLPKLDVNLGLRFDDYKSASSSDSVSENMFNYQAGIVYKLTENGRIYANYATSMNPTGDNLGQAGGADGAASGAALNDLDPEKSKSIEIGTKWELFDGDLALNAAIFETKKTDARSYDAEGILSNDGDNRVRGVELSSTGQITPAWNLSAGYVYLDPEILDYKSGAKAENMKGKQMKFIANHSANLWTTYALTDKFKFGGGATYVGKRFVDDVNTYYLPDHIRYDAFAQYQVIPEFGLQFNINNITNERIYDASHVGVFSTIAPGRSFAVKGTYRF
ncbi:TonB-dependent receptor [Acinetobacter chinensis]|nr:TonB-dependent siderophore receptor [Acinetobacter chinensis]